MTETVMMTWGTWEELLLGGAVLRHGTLAWDAVASELRSRTLYPFCFTAEVCKAKYEDLRARYAGSNEWFEELRKERVSELKRELEKSQDSIGSLETKLEILKAEKGEDIENDEDIKYNSSRTESPPNYEDRIGFSGKETSNSKDGLSAGSFTEETRTNWSPECQIPTNVSTEEIAIKKEDDGDDERESKIKKVEIVGDGCDGGLLRLSSLRRRRGKRKRKDCSNHSNNNKETSFESRAEVLMAVDDQDGGSGGFDQSTKSSEKVVLSDLGKEDNVGLMKIFGSIMEDENASVFRSRLDSQKRARYRKTIKRHVDFNNIRLRINNGSITSRNELYRDLLLLSNNALIYYPKDSHEYASALRIRDLTNKKFRQVERISGDESGGSGGASGGGDAVSGDELPLCNLVVKPRSVRPPNHKIGRKTQEKNSCEEISVAAVVAVAAQPEEVVLKKGMGRTGKGGRGNGVKRSETGGRGGGGRKRGGRKR